MPIWLIIVIVFLVISALYLILTYNALVKSKTHVNESFSTMDIYLKQRWDLIPNLVEVVKGYANYEKETLAKIVNLRSKSYENLKQEEKIEANKNITNEITKILTVAENYPDLKSNQNFLSLQDSLNKVENNIAQSRKYYNANVRDYNIKVNTIPSNMVAKIFGFKSLSMFEISDDQKENVDLKL